MGANFSGRGFGHTAFDTLDKIELRNLQDAAAVLSRVLMRIAGEEKWPVKQRTRRQVEQIEKKNANLEILAVENELEKLYRRKDRKKRREGK